MEIDDRGLIGTVPTFAWSGRGCVATGIRAGRFSSRRNGWTILKRVSKM